jgi:exopolyphosphatase/guanosine-5'-triphosphate,3'-diphosphate pyrophosphatase
MEPLLNAIDRKDVALVGTGGTTTILARMSNELESFDRARIEGTRLGQRAVLEHMVHLWSLSIADRKKIPGLPSSRADVIIMGVAIYESVMQQLQVTELYVSTRGLRFGALLDTP